MNADSDRMRRLPGGILEANEQQPIFAERQMSAVLAACGEAIRERRDLSILIFGPPGSGKTTFANQLRSQLAKVQPRVKELNSQTFMVGHGGMPSYEKWQRFVEQTEKRRPVLVTLDEIEYFGTPRTTSSLSALLQILEKRAPIDREKTRKESKIIIAIANYPKILGSDVLARIDHIVYLPVYDKATISSLLRNLGVSNENEVAKYIVTYLGGRNPPLRGLYTACQKVLREDPSLLRSMDPREVAKLITSYIEVVPRSTEIEAFEEANSWFISKSETFVEKYAGPKLEQPSHQLGPLEIIRANKASEIFKLGNLSYENANMVQALEYFHQAMRIYTKLADEDKRFLADVGLSFKSMGIVHKAMSAHDKALNYFQKANSIFNQISSRDMKVAEYLASTLILMGEAYFTLKKFDNAVECLEEVVQLAKQQRVSISTYALVSTEELLARTYLESGKPEPAKSHIASGESLLCQAENRNLPFTEDMRSKFTSLAFRAHAIDESARKQ